MLMMLQIIGSLQAQTTDDVKNAFLDWASGAVSRIVTVAFIIILAFIALRLLRSLVQRIVQGILQSREGTSRELQQRSSTLAQIIQSTGTFIILFVAIFTILANLGISLAPVLASAGIAGLAIAFGAQSLISDTFNGFFVLLEGQFAVGDFIRVGQASGTVEEFSLRRTVIRSMDGAAVTIPNGEVRIVENLSKGWSRAVVEIAVAPEADEQQVIEIMHAVLDLVQEDPDFGSKIVDAPNILGMTSVESNRLMFRAFIKTEPMEQFLIARELRRRLRRQLIESGVPLPPRTIDIVGGGVS